MNTIQGDHIIDVILINPCVCIKSNVDRYSSDSSDEWWIGFPSVVVSVFVISYSLVIKFVISKPPILCYYFFVFDFLNFGTDLDR